MANAKILHNKERKVAAISKLLHESRMFLFKAYVSLNPRFHEKKSLVERQTCSEKICSEDISKRTRSNERKTL
jgi:hypothetical protein